MRKDRSRSWSCKVYDTSLFLFFIVQFLFPLKVVQGGRKAQHVGQHFDQHQLINMLVRFALGTNMFAKEKMKEKCWPKFLKKLRNVG